MYSWLTDLWKQQHTSQRRWGKKPTSWKRNVITLQLKRPHISKDPYSNQGNGTLKKVQVKGKTGEANGRWEEWGSGEEWAHHEESRVHHSPCCWDDLTSSSVERLLSYDRVQDLELDISDGWRQQNTRLTLMRKGTFWQSTVSTRLGGNSSTRCNPNKTKIFSIEAACFSGAGIKERTYVRHTEVLPWCPTGSLAQYCLWLNQAVLCPPVGETQVDGGLAKTLTVQYPCMIWRVETKHS